MVERANLTQNGESRLPPGLYRRHYEAVFSDDTRDVSSIGACQKRLIRAVVSGLKMATSEVCKARCVQGAS
jgi:hypothetical protein